MKRVASSPFPMATISSPDVNSSNKTHATWDDKNLGETRRMNPADYVRYFIPHEDAYANPATSNFALNYHKTNISPGYTMAAVTAIRANDLATLRKLHAAGHDFNACNANGEYLIHLACRRSSAATVQFLLTEAKVCPTVRDTMGRTILHDICWKSFADVNTMALALSVVPPQMLLAQDVRGHTPFDFCRQNHWGTWITFLVERHAILHERLSLRLAEQ